MKKYQSGQSLTKSSRKRRLRSSGIITTRVLLSSRSLPIWALSRPVRFTNGKVKPLVL